MRGTQALHADAAERAHQEPGTWVMAHVYPSGRSGQSVVWSIRGERGPVAYRPFAHYEVYAAAHTDGIALWVRYIAGLANVRPMPETLTVRVADATAGCGWDNVRVTPVVISSKCARCGGPRGAVRPYHFVRGGKRFWCDVWENTCGHVDEYGAVIAEAALLKRLGKTSVAEGPEIRGVEGGEHAAAVDLIAELLKDDPWLKAHVAAAALDEGGHTAAAEAVRSFVGMTGVGRQTSALSAARFLIDHDNGLHPSGTWADGRIAYDFESITDTPGGTL